MAQRRATGPKVHVSKMDKRFSTLFLEPPRLSPDKSAEIRTSPSKMKEFLSRLFEKPPRRSPNPSTEEEKSTTREQNTDHLWDTVIALTKPKSAPKKASAIQKTVKPLPGPKPQGGRNANTKMQTNSSAGKQSVTIRPPPSTASIDLPTYPTKDILYKGKGKPLQSSRDSKFSSISSLSSLNLSSPNTTRHTSTPSSTTTTAAPLHITLSRSELSHLQSHLRRTHRRLLKQEHLMANLSANLHSILSRKESQLPTLKRLGKCEQAHMLQALFQTKEHCGRLFLRKAAFLQHSFSTLDQLVQVVEEAEREAEDAVPEQCTSWRAGEGRVFALQWEEVEVWVGEMRRGVERQRGLDGEVERCVGERAKEERWVVSMGEKVMMSRFVGFLAERLGALEDAYGSIEGVVEGVEVLFGV